MRTQTAKGGEKEVPEIKTKGIYRKSVGQTFLEKIILVPIFLCDKEVRRFGGKVIRTPQHHGGSNWSLSGRWLDNEE